MENPELLVENRENKSYTETEIQGLTSLFKEKEASFEVENQEINKLKKPETRNKKVYAGIPILAIIFAEILIYFGRVKEALWIHIIILMGLSLSITLMKNKESTKPTRS